MFWNDSKQNKAGVQKRLLQYCVCAWNGPRCHRSGTIKHSSVCVSRSFSPPPGCQWGAPRQAQREHKYVFSCQCGSLMAHNRHKTVQPCLRSHKLNKARVLKKSTPNAHETEPGVRNGTLVLLFMVRAPRKRLPYSDVTISSAIYSMSSGSLIFRFLFCPTANLTLDCVGIKEERSHTYIFYSEPRSCENHILRPNKRIT